MDGFDCVIAGAGVIGLAIAKEVAATGKSVLVVERERAIGLGTSSRNSEVIHAGIYYKPGSLKATLCIEGGARLYRYCENRRVPHSRLGKLIVAVEENQLHRMEAIAANARQNGVDDLSFLTRAEIAEMEPQLRCAGAIFSPSTGIVDSGTYMQCLLFDAEEAGAIFAFHTRIIGGSLGEDGVTLTTRGESGETFEVSATTFVNAAGLDAQAVALSIDGFPRSAVPPLFLARGCYFQLTGRSPFRRLIYPMPSDGGLGVHLTLDLAGTARFGPDVEWIDDIDYSVDPKRADMFREEILHYWPHLPENALAPAYCGIRPKLSGPGEAPADFMLQGPRDHNAGPIVNLFGMESPGLTSSLAIGERVASLLAC